MEAIGEIRTGRIGCLRHGEAREDHVRFEIEGVSILGVLRNEPSIGKTVIQDRREGRLVIGERGNAAGRTEAGETHRTAERRPRFVVHLHPIPQLCRRASLQGDLHVVVRSDVAHRVRRNDADC